MILQLEKVDKSQLDSILKNQFYSGTMRTKHGLAELHYQPLISTSLYQRVQDVAAGYHKKPHKKIREPFLTMLDFKNRPKEWGRLDGFRMKERLHTLTFLATG